MATMVTRPILGPTAHINKAVAQLREAMEAVASGRPWKGVPRADSNVFYFV